MSKFIFLDLETTNLLDQLEKPRDIILQLAYVVVDGKNKEVYDVKTNPQCEINAGCMMIHGITPEMIEGLPKVEDTDEYSHLKELVESGEYTFVAHNANFDITCLSYVGIDVREFCQVIDTYIIAEIINDQMHLERDMNKLGYLKYYHGLYKQKGKINEMFGVDGDTYHEAVSDILDMILYFKFLKSEYSMDIDHMVHFSNNKTILTYIPFGKNRGEKFEDLNYNQLKWYATLDNENVAYTASKFI